MTLRSAVQLRVGVVNGCREVFNRPELYNTLNVGTIAAVVLHFVTQIRRHRVQRALGGRGDNFGIKSGVENGGGIRLPGAKLPPIHEVCGVGTGTTLE